jgi:HEAT repeat protein
MKKTREDRREQRGETSLQDDLLLEPCENALLMGYLFHHAPKIRTSAAKILGQRKYGPAVPALCRALKSEVKLYPRQAICDALAIIGRPSIPLLIDLLGEIGQNQEKSLPIKGFYKNSYPLPRDIAARTLTRIGEPALEGLIDAIKTAPLFKTEQAVDAVGHISFYARNRSALSFLHQLVKKTHGADILYWKVIRAFAAFNDDAVISQLQDDLLNHPLPPIRWEAARSLGMIGRKWSLKYLKTAIEDKHPEVRNMALRAIYNIESVHRRKL